MFLKGRENDADEAHSEHPSKLWDENSVKREQKLLNTNRRLNVRLMYDLLDVPKSSVHRIMTKDLLMRKVCTKLVLKVLSDEQKHSHERCQRRPSDPCDEGYESLTICVT